MVPLLPALAGAGALATGPTEHSRRAGLRRSSAGVSASSGFLRVNQLRCGCDFCSGAGLYPEPLRGGPGLLQQEAPDKSQQWGLVVPSADLAGADTLEVRRPPNSQLSPSPTQTRDAARGISRLARPTSLVCQFPPPPPFFLINSAAASLCSSARAPSQHPGMRLPAGWR